MDDETLALAHALFDLARDGGAERWGPTSTRA